MKYVKEIVIIFGITMVGELLNMFIPLPGSRRSVWTVHSSRRFMHESDLPFRCGSDGNLLLDLMPGHVYSGRCRDHL